MVEFFLLFDLKRLKSFKFREIVKFTGPSKKTELFFPSKNVEKKIRILEKPDANICHSP